MTIEKQNRDNIWTPRHKGDAIQGSVTNIRDSVYGINLLIDTEYLNNVTILPYPALDGFFRRLKLHDYIEIIDKGLDMKEGGNYLHKFEAVVKSRVV